MRSASTAVAAGCGCLPVLDFLEGLASAGTEVSDVRYYIPRLSVMFYLTFTSCFQYATHLNTTHPPFTTTLIYLYFAAFSALWCIFAVLQVIYQYLTISIGWIGISLSRCLLAHFCSPTHITHCRALSSSSLCGGFFLANLPTLTAFFSIVGKRCVLGDAISLLRSTGSPSDSAHCCAMFRFTSLLRCSNVDQLVVAAVCQSGRDARHAGRERCV